MMEAAHPSSEELLRAVDGELSSWRALRMRAHVAGCPACRARMAALETGLRSFVELHRSEFDPRLPAAAGPHALLKAQLAELAAGAAANQPRLFRPRFAQIASVCLCAAAFLAAALLLTRSAATRPEARAIPEARLTPGATFAATRDDVCGSTAAPGAQLIPASVQRKVFESYGLPHARPDAYEVDYLISPALGGSGDIRNLWPQPYAHTVWNAHVKDELEDLLHDMVCDGSLDLRTAQHDIATDWIAAYKKYFHTGKPVSR